MRKESFQIEYDVLKAKYQSCADKMYSKKLCELDANQLQNVVASVIKTDVIKPYMEQSLDYFSTKRIAIYFSMEFLIGRIVLDALVNTGLKKMTSKIFADEGVDINILEEVEDTALGNGGLGRLAACFMESAATTGYPVFGFGVYYKYGLFKQQFDGFNQVEEKDDWVRDGDPWFEPNPDKAVVVNFKDTKVKAIPYVLPIIGYNKSWRSFDQNVFPLTLWKSEAIEGVSSERVSNISDYLYPNDSEPEGKMLRICQEYFFASATMQKLVNTHLAKHGTLDNFEDYYIFQMNDTHPVLACVEYIRLLEYHGYSFEEASKKARKCFAYTNHTVLAEALERWDVNLFKAVVPSEIFKIIQDLNQELIDSFIKMDLFKFENNETNWRKVDGYELIRDGMVHMSRIACYMGNAINGVAAIHSEILKDSVLNGWYQVYPERFTNCTNGVTPRRWIRCCNPALASMLDSELGPGWTTNLAELERLDSIKTSPRLLKEFSECKMAAKKALAEYIKMHEGIDIDPHSIFDCQVKRIHLYKRQLMNAFRILYIYASLKNGTFTDFPNTTFIIGGKAASSYAEAKRVIVLLKDIQETINNDPDMTGKMKVVFVTNFNVSYGEKIYSAANFSEQISTAGKEASGTGNMKFMMNGAPTIGTMDGANIEIVNEAGIENNYIFGATVDEIKNGLHYNPREFIESSPEMQVIMPYLVGGKLHGNYQDIVDGLQFNDEFYVMYDLQSYIYASMRAFSDYNMEQKTGIYRFHTLKALENVIHSGKFSSDRTIKEYAEKIWHIEPITP